MTPRRLTDRIVSGLKASGREQTLTDTVQPGLELRVAAGSGTKSWTIRYYTDGRRRRLTIGRYPNLSLAAAREEAKKRLAEVALGGDPAERKRARRRAGDTVKDVAELYLDKHALGPDVGPRDPKTGRIADVWTFEPQTGTPRKRTWAEDRRKLEVEIIPRWGRRPLAKITRRDVRDLLEAIADRGAPTQANRVRSLLSKLFTFAAEREIVEANPVLWTSKPGEEKPRDRVLGDGEIRRLWEATDAMPKPQAAALFRLMLLTGQRLGEIRDMAWGEIDFGNRVWTIPGARSKNRKPHRVPLSDAVTEIIVGLPRFDPHVLAGARGNRQTYVLAREIGLEDFQPGRDLRSTAATRMAAAGIPRLHVALVLNHSDKSVTGRHYDRAGYDREKRQALDTLARVVLAVVNREDPGKVVPITKGADA